VFANVQIRAKYTGTVALLRTCGKKYAMVHTMQDMFIFCRLQFAKPCSAARVVNMAILYMHSNSPDTRSIWISGYSALVDDISCYPYVKKSTVNMTNW